MRDYKFIYSARLQRRELYKVWAVVAGMVLLMGIVGHLEQEPSAAPVVVAGEFR